MGVLTERFTVDDFDGDSPAKTIKFGLDGVFYEIDLCEENEQRLRDLLANYIPHAKRVRPFSTAKKSKKKTSTAKKS